MAFVSESDSEGGWAITDHIPFEYEFANEQWRSTTGLDWRPFPVDVIGIEQQKQILADLAGRSHWRQNPLLPPYSGAQLSALEARHDIVFPPLLRYYLGHVSREIVTARNGAAIVTPTPSLGAPGWWSSGFNYHSIPFKGPFAGFVTYKSNGVSQVQTLYDLLQSSLRVPMTRRGKHMAPLAQHRFCPDVGEHIQGYVCSASRVSSILNSERVANECLAELETQARRIQKRFRLWKWRKDVFWNPHTEVGRLGLLISTRAFLAIESRNSS